jgi:hypothetical protein
MINARSRTLPLTSNDCLDNVPARIEEEEFADDESLDDHHRASCNDCQQADDIEHPQDVEDDIAWPSQRFPEATHGDSDVVPSEWYV